MKRLALLLTIGLVHLFSANIALADLEGVGEQHLDEYRIEPKSDILLIDGRYYKLTGEVKKWGSGQKTHMVVPWRAPGDPFVRVPTDVLKTSLYLYTGNGSGASFILEGRSRKLDDELVTKGIFKNFRWDPSYHFRLDYNNETEEVDYTKIELIPFRFLTKHHKHFDKKKEIATRYAQLENPFGYAVIYDRRNDRRAHGLLYGFTMKIDQGFELLGHNAQACLVVNALKGIWGSVKFRGFEGKHMISAFNPSACLNVDVSEKIKFGIHGGFDLGGVFKSMKNNETGPAFVEFFGGSHISYGSAQFSYKYSKFGSDLDLEGNQTHDLFGNYTTQHMFGAAFDF